MSKKRTIYAKNGVKFGDLFIPAKSTIDVSEELYKDLQETRFFRHGILKDVTKKEKNKENKKEENLTDKK